MVQNIFRASIVAKRKDSPMYVGILAWVLRVLNGLIHDLYVPHTFWRQISLNEWSRVTLWRIYGTIGVQWYFCCVTLRLYNDTISSTDETVAIWISTWFRSELCKEWLFHRWSLSQSEARTRINLSKPSLETSFNGQASRNVLKRSSEATVS